MTSRRRSSAPSPRPPAPGGPPPPASSPPPVPLRPPPAPPALSALPIAGHPEGIVRRLAQLARDCGLDGVVCAAPDLPVVRGACGAGFLTVVPGIRPAGSPVSDQKRVATPAQALAASADLLVVGRPVTAAPDPDRALDELLAEIESLP